MRCCICQCWPRGGLGPGGQSKQFSRTTSLRSVSSSSTSPNPFLNTSQHAPAVASSSRWSSSNTPKLASYATSTANDSSTHVHDEYDAFTSFFAHPEPGEEVQGRLSGLRVSIKDNFATQELPTTCASKALDSYTSPYDATVVSLLRRNGAHLVGKTNMDEFGMGSAGVFSNRGSVKNPLNTARVAGGSSSGAAASVAAGLCDV